MLGGKKKGKIARAASKRKEKKGNSIH